MEVTYIWPDGFVHDGRTYAQTTSELLRELESNGWSAKVVKNLDGYDVIQASRHNPVFGTQQQTIIARLEG